MSNPQIIILVPRLKQRSINHGSRIPRLHYTFPCLHSSGSNHTHQNSEQTSASTKSNGLTSHWTPPPPCSNSSQAFYKECLTIEISIQSITIDFGDLPRFDVAVGPSNDDDVVIEEDEEEDWETESDDSDDNESYYSSDDE
ncbi:Tocopherol O-methyltransferase, chloroplastic [Prunus dulcis]|uniref:Tocopherol O-methyltransferase, chloroplastic n=1 Tax=Prunus dulcis TaxID=3755 RepID=A0A4Y1RUE5_PRUDU|nr:hypothetical protein L3X38_038260 [Prunus dulcis]BBH07407.1 Tocopherol O-methyltransferase, chloroplastic [Prunus dulcis]